MKRGVGPVLLVLSGILLIVAGSALAVYADIQRIGCESAGQLLGPASPTGYGLSETDKPGACFVSFVEVSRKDMSISRLACGQNLSWAACQTFRQQAASGWTNYFGSRCTSLSFFGGAACNCTHTGQGCQQGDWPVEIIP